MKCIVVATVMEGERTGMWKVDEKGGVGLVAGRMPVVEVEAWEVKGKNQGETDHFGGLLVYLVLF